MVRGHYYEVPFLCAGQCAVYSSQFHVLKLVSEIHTDIHGPLAGNGYTRQFAHFRDHIGPSSLRLETISVANYSYDTPCADGSGCKPHVPDVEEPNQTLSAFRR